MRHPALAIDPAGDALLAYNARRHATSTSTCAARSRSPTATAAARSPRRRSSTRCRSSAPAVAMGATARGSSPGRTTAGVYAVSVSADGVIGKVKRIASPDWVVGLVAAAGRGRGGHAGVGRPPRGRQGRVPAHPLLRPRPQPRAGHAFASRRTVASTTDYVRRVSIARRPGRPGDAGLEPASTSATIARSATAGSRARSSPPRLAPGSRFPAPRSSRAGGRLYLAPPAVAAAHGRVALTWGSGRSATTSACRPPSGRRAPRPARRPSAQAAPTRRPTAACRPASPRSTPTGRRPSLRREAGKPPAAPVVTLMAADGS